MKKFLAFLLMFVMVFTFTACGGEDTETSSSSGSQATSSAASQTSSKATSETKSEASSNASQAQSQADSSADTSSGTSSSPVEMPKFTNKFVSFGADVNVQIRATDSTSIRLTKINEPVVAGDVALFTKSFGASLKTGTETYKDFAVLVCTYDHSIFGYKKTSLVDDESDKSATAIPADGFVIAISKLQKSEIAKLKNIKDSDKFFPHGVRIADLTVTLKKATKAPTIDGKINANEYGTALWKIDEKNKFWDYSQFVKDNYYVKGEVYATYDDNNFYLGVIVDSPEHYNPVTESTKSGMYQYYCIQVNLYAVDPLSDYMSEHFDHVIDQTAFNEGMIRQYGFGLSDDGETLWVVWMGVDKNFTGQAKITRDDGAQKTYYEVAIPWSELGKSDNPFSIKGVDKVGFSISINCTNKDDVAEGRWKNLKLRDGGGIIGRNDWSKGVTVVLGK